MVTLDIKIMIAVVVNRMISLTLLNRIERTEVNVDQCVWFFFRVLESNMALFLHIAPVCTIKLNIL